VLEYGLTDRLQFEMRLPYEWDNEENAAGFANVGLGALWQVEQGADGSPRFAVGTDLTFPSSSSRVGDDAWTLEPFALIYRAGNPFDVNAGLGLPLSQDEGAWDVGGEGALAFIADLGPCAGTLELLGELDDARFELSAAVGTVWHAGSLELGFAVAAGLTDDAPDWQLMFTLTREWQIVRQR
jgi:hypothetical protein